MKTKRLVLLLIVSASLLARARGEHLARAEPILIRSVNLVDVENSRVLPRMDVLLEDGRIKQIGHKLNRSKRARIIEGAQGFLVPGLWDMHVHTAGLRANPAWSGNTLLPLLIANGVTGIRDMGGDLVSLRAWKEQISRGDLVGPEIVAAGPMLDGSSDDPSVIAVRTPDEARQAVDKLTAQHVDFIKVLSGLNRDSYFAIVAESKAQHLPIAGHVPAVIGVAEASNAGQKSIEHILYGGISIACSNHEEKLRGSLVAAMQSGSIRELARVEDEANQSFSEEKAQNVWETFRRNRTWIVPTLVSAFVSSHLEGLIARDPHVMYLPKSARDEWTAEKLSGYLQPDKLTWWNREFLEQLEMVRRMHKAGVLILAGTDSLDIHNIIGFALSKELELLVQAGFTPMEALQSATIRPAEFLERTDVGSVATGRMADLVLLSADPTIDVANVRRIQAVFVRGRYFTRGDLDQMLGAVRMRNCGTPCSVNSSQ